MHVCTAADSQNTICDSAGDKLPGLICFSTFRIQLIWFLLRHSQRMSWVLLPMLPYRYFLYIYFFHSTDDLFLMFDLSNLIFSFWLYLSFEGTFFVCPIYCFISGLNLFCRVEWYCFEVLLGCRKNKLFW